MKQWFVLLCLPSILFADPDLDSSASGYARSTCRHYSNYIGFAAGMTTGSGISLRKWFNEKWGLQINVLPVYYQEKYDSLPDDTTSRYNGYSDFGSFSLGLTYLRNLVGMKYVRVLFYSGGNINTTYEKSNYYHIEHKWINGIDGYQNAETHHTADKLENKISLGAGGGCEFYFWRFALHFMCGIYGGYTIEKKTWAAGPSVEGGLHFRF